jgi:hypothetical protein
MKRLPALVFSSLLAIGVSGACAGVRASAAPIAYAYSALPGPATTCKWFDDNINDHSLDAIIRQTDLIYNRAPLEPGVNVAVNGTATTALGGALVSFDYTRRLMCVTSEAIDPTQPQPTPTPPTF